MHRYIDADELLELYDINDLEEDGNWKIPLEVVKQNIKDMPTADVEPVRHARWEDIEQHSWSVNLACRCQICGWLVNYTQSKAFAYCPNCGARMDGKE